MKKFVLITLLLSGCAANNATSVTTLLAAAQTDLANAINFVQTAEGIANVAEIAFPQIAPTITAIENVLNPLMTTAQNALNDATQTAPALQALTMQLTTQAANLTQVAAPAVKVVPSVTTTPVAK